MILIHHFSQQLFDASHLLPFKYIGVFAVALFFFLSSYGMTMSLMKNPDYLKTFLFKRLIKIYVPYVIVNTLTILIMVLFYDASYTVLDTLLFVSGIKLIDASLWFVHRILIYYLVFYMSFKLFNRKTALISLFLFTAVYCVICYKLGRGLWEFRTAFLFPLGIFFALNHKRIFSVITRNYSKIVVIGTLCVLSSLYLYYHNDAFPLLTSALASLFLVLYIPLLLMKVNISSKPFSFLGKISYEIYLVHMKVLVISYSLVHITKSYYLYVYIGIVIIIAYVFSKMLNFNMGCRLKRAPQPPLSGALPVTDSTMISS